MKTIRLLPLLAAAGFALGAPAQEPGSGESRPPAPPPARQDGPGERPSPPRSHEGPHHHGGSKGHRLSEEQREHLREAFKHLKAAGFGHLAERIEQSLRDRQESGKPSGPQAGPRRDGPHPWSHRFQHPRSPWGEGRYGHRRGGSPDFRAPFARPRQDDRRPHGAGDRGPDKAEPDKAQQELREQVQRLQRQVEELARIIKERPAGPHPERREGDRPGPDGPRREGRPEQPPGPAAPGSPL